MRSLRANSTQTIDTIILTTYTRLQLGRSIFYKGIEMRKLSIFSTTLTLVFAFMLPVANAEGYWTSSISNVAPGFNSRTWTDKNQDSVATKIRLDDCRDSHRTHVTSNTAQIQLTRRTGALQPDENRGRKVFYCQGSDSKSWGRQPASDYRFAVIRINGREERNPVQARLSASYVRTDY